MPKPFAVKSTEVVEGVELKSCPFCGEEARLKVDPGLFGTPVFWAKCSNRDCGVSTQAKMTEAGALDLWNKRV